MSCRVMVDLRAEIVVMVQFVVHPSVRALADQIGESLTYPSIASDQGAHCQSGSSWHQDKDIGLELDSPTRSPVPLHHLIELVSMVRLYAGVDYVLGIRALMTSGSLYSVFPLARSALDAFAYVSWKPAFVQELRVNRALLDHKSSLEQEKRRLEGLLKITERDGHTHHAARVKSDIALSTDDYTTAIASAASSLWRLRVSGRPLRAGLEEIESRARLLPAPTRSVRSGA